MAHQGRREHRPWICRWPLAIRRPPSTRLARRRHVVGIMNREECLCGIDLATERGDRGEAARLPLVVHGTGIRMRFGARPELDVRRLRSPGGTQWRRATHRSLHQSGSKVSGIRRPVSISPIPRPSMLSPLQEQVAARISSLPTPTISALLCDGVSHGMVRLSQPPRSKPNLEIHKVRRRTPATRNARRSEVAGLDGLAAHRTAHGGVEAVRGDDTEISALLDDRDPAHVVLEHLAERGA